MRIFLLSQGSSLATVDNLPLEDAQELYVTLQAGLWGPYGEAHKAYLTLAQMHLNKETAVAIATGKKYKPTQLPDFHKFFPSVEDFQSLGTGEVRRETKQKEQMARRAMLAIPTGDAPDWLKEAMSNDQK